jgi:hypothetical protein
VAVDVNGKPCIWLDFGAQYWYTRSDRVNIKPLILLTLLKRRGNPSLSAAALFSFVSDRSNRQENSE